MTAIDNIGFSDATKIKIRHMRRHGATILEIAQAIGRGRGSVQRLLNNREMLYMWTTEPKHVRSKRQGPKVLSDDPSPPPEPVRLPPLASEGGDPIFPLEVILLMDSDIRKRMFVDGDSTAFTSGRECRAG